MPVQSSKTFEKVDRAELNEAFGPIARIDLTEEVIRRFKRLLGEGKLKPGGRLPPERELASLLGISRPSLRHGLKALELMGTIESKRRHGTFVSESAVKVLEEPLSFIVLLDAVSFGELYEVRKTIEVEVAGLAAERADPQELEAIGECLKRQFASQPAPADFLEEDLNFHSLIAHASHNTLFRLFLGSLRRLITEKMQSLSELTNHDFASAYEEHSKVVVCLKQRDVAGARKAMLDHLEGVYARWQAVQAGRHT
jgi:GntR family transcriptional regulator, transcriptional repressor for pyruvate dehydrogenase complex